MDILILGLNYAPEPVGIAVYSAGLAEELAARGHRVTAIVGRPYYPDWKPFASSARGWSCRIENGVRVIHCPHYIPARPTGANRILHHLSFALSALPVAVREAARKPDFVFAVAPSLISTPIAWLAARLAGARMWLHVQDFEVEAAFATGLLKSGTRLANAALALERQLLGMADKISTISPRMMERLEHKGVAADRVCELRNWADDRVSWPSDAAANGYVREWGLSGCKVALYSGNIANKQGLETVIEAARLLRDRTDIAFLVCGRGPNRAHLEKRALSLLNVRFEDLQPHERLGELLSAATVHLLPQIADAADLVLPSKLTNMLASGRPVVAAAGVGTGLAKEVEGCGLVVPPEDPVAMAQAVVRLIDDQNLARRLGKTGRERAVRRWAKRAIVDGFEQQLPGVAGKQ